MPDSLRRALHQVLPILDWAPDYGLDAARGDLVAGVTVGVMLIPQGMAYAVLAGVPPIYGLFASLVPLAVYPVFGTSRHMAVGISAVSMVVVAAGVGGIAETGTPEYVALAILLTALVGLLEIAMGVARLGFLANLISRPVIIGFTFGAGLIIAAGQLGNLLGLEIGRSQYVYLLLLEAAGRVSQAHPPTVLLGLASIVALVGARRWKPTFPAEIAVVAAGALAARVLGLEGAGVALVGEIPAGLPLPGLVDVDFSAVRDLLPTVATLAAVQFMVVVSLTRVFAIRHKYRVDPNQELVALGATNFLGSLFQSIPISGSFSRSTVNERAGARTALSNVFAAGLVAVALLFFTPLLYHVPMPVLAAIIIVAAGNLVDVQEIRYLFRTKTSDGWVALATFVTTLGLGIQEGILVGIGVATLVFLYRISRPHVAELGHLPSTRSFKRVERFEEAEPMEGLLVLRVEAGFSFFNAKFLRDYILEKSRERDLRAVVIDGMSINHLDTTAVDALDQIVRTLEEWGIEIHFAGLTAPVRDVMENSGLGERVGEQRFHIDPYHAVLDILERWDAAAGTDRRARYREAAEQEREEVEPTAESPYL